jgi:hypothetical protein
MDRTGRCAVKVTPDVHANIRLIATALGIRQCEVVQRAIALYRERHADAVAELTDRRALGDLSGLSLRERIDAQRERLRALFGDAEVWIVERPGFDSVLMVDPLEGDAWDLGEAVEELTGLRVLVFAREHAERMGYRRAMPGSWHVFP